MEPDLDQWTSLFLIVACTGFFISFLLTAKTFQKKIAIYPALIVGAFSMVLVQYVLYWSHYQFVFPYLRFTPNVFLLLIAAWVVEYSFGSSKRTMPFPYLLLYLPALGGVILNLTYWTGIYNYQFGAFSLPEKILFLGVNPWLVVSVYIAATSFLFQIIQKSPDGKKKELQYLAVFLGLFTLAFASYFILVRFPFFSNEWDYAISFVMSAGIYSVGGLLALLPAVFESRESEEENAPLSNSEKTELLESEAARQIFFEINQIVADKKRYHREDLRLEALAKELRLPRNYLSYAINSETGKNFNRYVNDLRLAEAEKLLASEPDLPVKSIYFQVGFSNKASFYSAFKERHSCTPSEFRKGKSAEAVRQA